MAVVFKVSSALTHRFSDEEKLKPVEVIKIDKLKVSEKYLECYSRDTMQLNRYCFDYCEIPELSEEIFKTRIGELKTSIPLVYNESVRGYLKMYLIRKRPLVSRVVGRSYEYYPVFEEILARHGMPDELKHLSIVESALNKDAVSWCGATGIWQFMAGTARIYNLRVDSVDERKDLIKSTEAAFRFLRDLNTRYGDWLLAIAAYNCGAGNVNKAIRRAGGNKYGKKNFWQIKKFLPKETQGYVPAFIAACYFMNHYHSHNIRAISPEYLSMEIKCVEIEEDVSFKSIARFLDITTEELSSFNLAYEKPGRIEFKDTIPSLMLPETLMEKFKEFECQIYNEERLTKNLILKR